MIDRPSETIVGDAGRMSSTLAGKILVDCSNVTTVIELREPLSLVERISRAAPQARFVKAFNAIDAAALAYVFKRNVPVIHGQRTAVFHCGDDIAASAVVRSLIQEVELDPIDCGPLSNATLLEALGVLGDYLARNVFGELFAINVAREPKGGSPLDALM